MNSKKFEEFGSCLFNEEVMKTHLPKPVYTKWKSCINKQESLDQNTADAIAHAMKEWALSKGATHFTHWFQPMTGTTAEKHEAFIDRGDDGMPLTRFSGKLLIKGEPDASSFPSGGLRATFEARGYTYWDLSSPAFIRDNVLCIPTIFVSYNGEPLDKKAPLLKATEALNKQALRILGCFKDKDIKSVTPMVGLEQEYFLIDKKHYDSRLDLRLCQRTLFGAKPPKSQASHDHYFGSISDRVSEFMKDVNEECWKLGIYSTTEHNEAAPGQYEIAPLFCDANIAVDQNQLMMDILKKTAKKHDLACLLHEKPFANVNGSGKHNNWSLVCDDGTNLFDPMGKPNENYRFLLFVCAIIKAVDTYPELLRMASSSAGNDYRLGAHEAPPAIISIYMGHELEQLLKNIEEDSDKKIDLEKTIKPMPTLSVLPKDSSDRNRTSPFAFTGNKFEFRMLGSSRSAATTNTVLCTIMAETLSEIADELEQYKYVQDTREAAMNICRKILKKHSRILFSGDGYSPKWIEEAKKRGLPNIPSYVESIASLIDEKAVHAFENQGVFTKDELMARVEILYDQYIKTINVEHNTLMHMCDKEIIPALIKEIKFYSDAKASLNQTVPYYEEHIQELTGCLSSLNLEIKKFKDLHIQSESIKDIHEKGIFIRYRVCEQLEEVRKILDKIENTISKENWPYPTYTEMLYELD